MYRYGHSRIDQKATDSNLSSKEVMNDGAGGGIRTPHCTGLQCKFNAVDNPKLNVQDRKDGISALLLPASVSRSLSDAAYSHDNREVFVY